MAKTKAKTKVTTAPPEGEPTPGVTASRPVSSFKKIIMRPGVRYGVKKGKPVEFTADEARLKTLATNAKEQIDAGHTIPAPPRHYKGGKALSEQASDKFVWDASLNLGYWKDSQFVEDASQFDPTFEPGPAWVGVLEAPGSADDLNTPAGKIGTTMKEVSPLIMPSFVDGSGKTWKDYVGHIALPVHARDAAQENFVAMSAEAPEDDESYEVVFSDIGASDNSIDGAGTEQPGGDDPELLEVLEMLRQPPHNLDLPEETTRDTFVQVLRIAVRQSVASARQADTMTQPPTGASSRPAPIAMSAEDMADNKAINALVARATRETKSALTGRLNKLRASGVIQREENFNTLKADIDAIAFSAEQLDENTGDFPVPFVAKQLDILESEGRPLTGNVLDGDATSFSAPEGAEPLDAPAFGLIDIPADDMNAILERAIQS